MRFAFTLGLVATFFAILLAIFVLPKYRFGKNLRTVFGREFANYFNSLIGYIFIIVFVLINAGLFMMSFFLYPRADMRSFFNLLPIILCIFIPLVTMRLWAEERKENTIEMLLTFPLRPVELVLGKFLASFLFFALALAGTLPIPIMLGFMGSPDWGVTFTSYLGALFLGGFFLSMGIFLSGLVKDQIVAAVLSLLGCFFVYLLGMDFVASTVDSWISGKLLVSLALALGFGLLSFWGLPLRDRAISLVVAVSVGVVILSLTFIPFLAKGTQELAGLLLGQNFGLGSFLMDILGVTNHYQTFIRGVLEVHTLLYFFVWTAIFLFLNGFFLEGRIRRGATAVFSVAVALCLLSGMAFNYIIADTSWSGLYLAYFFVLAPFCPYLGHLICPLLEKQLQLSKQVSLVSALVLAAVLAVLPLQLIKFSGRFDCTEGKIYTVSDASKKILSQLKVPVQVTLYITNREKMPVQLKTLEQDVVYKLDELKSASHGQLLYKVVNNLEVANLFEMSETEEIEPTKEATKKQQEETVEKTLRAKGIRPFMVQALQEDQQITQPIYAALSVAYKEKKEEVIPQVLPEKLGELEYDLISRVFRLVRAKKPIVALVAPKEAVDISDEMRQMYARMGRPVPTQMDPYKYVEGLLQHEEYEVKRVSLSKSDPLPKEYDTLVIINPRKWSPRHKWEAARALHNGKNVFLAVQNYIFDYQPMGNRGVAIQKNEESPQVNDWLQSYGVEVDTDVLMDVNQETISFSDENDILGQLFGGMQLKTPIQIVATHENMNKEVSITSRLSSILYLWGNALNLKPEILKENKLQCTVLMNTTNEAWKAPGTRALVPSSDFKPKEGKQYPLMALLEGQFPDLYHGQERPAWPKATNRFEEMSEDHDPSDKKEDEAVAAPTPAPGQLILMGCSQFFRRDFFLSRGHVDLLRNCVDVLSLGSDLIHIRARKDIDRQIDRPKEWERTLWKLFTMLLVPVMLILLGVTRGLVRRWSRERYLLSQAL